MVEVKARSDSGRRGANSTGGDDGYGGDDGGWQKGGEGGSLVGIAAGSGTQCLEVAVRAAMSELELRWGDGDGGDGAE